MHGAVSGDMRVIICMHVVQVAPAHLS